jgi:PST family polysaccharide transporter
LETATLAVHDVIHRTDSPLVKHFPKFLRDRISGRHNLQTVIGNSSWLFSDKILRMGGGLIVGVWVARYLGPGRFGLLNFAIAFTGIFSVIATLGMDGIVIRDLTKYPEKTDDILGSVFILRVVAALITFAIVMVWISIMRRGDTLMIWMVAIIAMQFIFQSLNVIDLYFQSKVQSKYTVYATNAAFLLVTAAKIVLLVLKAPLVAFAWTISIEIAIASAFLLVVYRVRGLVITSWRAKLPIMRDLLRDSWPLILNGISVMISVRIDQVLIGQMLNDKQVGIYSAAARISEVWYFIPFAISTSMLPLLVESRKQSEALYYERLQKHSNILALIAIGFVVLITILAGPITRVLYGAAYAGSAGVLRILIWGGSLIPVAVTWSYWMLLENRIKTMFYFNVFGAILNVILNLLLIPHFGIIGSAYATLISYNAWLFVLCPFMKSQRKVLGMMLKAMSLVWLFSRRKT